MAVLYLIVIFLVCVRAFKVQGPSFRAPTRLLYQSNALGKATSDGNSPASGSHYDVIVVGSGIGGLCAANILRHVHKKSVCVFESHYLAGGCAHSFERGGHTFESGPTILLGCSKPPFNPLRQVLDICGLSVDWVPYESWGVLGDGEPWDLRLGLTGFRDHLISTGRTRALEEFDELRRITLGLAESASKIPAMAMRSGEIKGGERQGTICSFHP